MLTSFIYRKKDDGINKKVYILGLPIYSKRRKDGYIKRSYFFSLLQIREYDYEKVYYFCKLKVYKNLNITKLLIDFQNKNELITKLENNILIKNNNEILKKNKNDILAIIKNEIKENFSLLENSLYGKVKTLIQCQNVHKETFGPYKNAFLGSDVVLVASGPTAKFHIPKDGVIYVGVNNACLLDNVKLDYLFCQDFYMNEEKRNAIVNYRPDKCKKFFGRIPDERIAECRKSAQDAHVTRCPKCFIERANAKEYYVDEKMKFTLCMDIENEPLSAWGIVFPAMQFILHAHPKRIYLVGCDCSSGFFYKSEVTFDNSPMKRGWKILAEHIKEFYPDIEVISLNPVGLRGLFKDEYSEDYLASLSEEERSCISV